MQSLTPLKRVLRDEGRKQSWLAAECGIHEATLSRIVNGLRADREIQVRIAGALGRPVADLFPADEARAA